MKKGRRQSDAGGLVPLLLLAEWLVRQAVRVE